MPEAQAEQLIVMMNRAPVLSRLEVCLPPFEVKISSLKKLAEGDLLVLPTQQFEVIIFEESNRIAAQGLYGTSGSTPSVLVKESRRKAISSDNSKKYEYLKISLGEVEKKDLIQGNIVKLHRDEMYDATLYIGKNLIAYARLVKVDKKTALQIGEVK
ncbi:MAG: hypothetical protein U9R26_07460 [Campylobacterota bacterium]|nr:hypothetical protein [Campylobacterota bacterium]